MIRRVLVLTGAAIVTVIGIGVLLRSPILGAAPAANERAEHARSTQFDATAGRFINRRPDIVNVLRDDGLSLALVGDWLSWFKARPRGRPLAALPEVRPDLATFLAPSGGLPAIWLGHSTVLLNVDGLVVLIDPVFSNSAAPVDFMVRRFQPPVLPLDALPPIDVVLISHDHYDHLDMDTIRTLSLHDALFVAPLGVGAHLRRWGVEATRIVERDWWDSHESDGVRFTAAPAQHFSGRGLTDGNRTLWASWIIEGQDAKLYYSGDSGYDSHFADIGKRFGPFDAALLENGQYDKAWSTVHLFPEQTLQAARDLGTARLLPLHWGMFELAFHDWDTPITTLARLAKGRDIELLTPLLGEIIDLSGDRSFEPWWERVR